MILNNEVDYAFLWHLLSSDDAKAADFKQSAVEKVRDEFAELEITLRT